MPINASYQYFAAEKKYDAAVTLEEKIAALQEMLREVPAHKGGENLRAELRLRLKKLLEKKEKTKKVGKGKKGIKKEGFQVALIGLANAGKSYLLRRLTNAEPVVSETPYTTKVPELGTMDFSGVKAQIIDFPAIEGKDIDFGTLNTSDCLLLVVVRLEDIPVVSERVSRAMGKRILVVNKIDTLSANERHKLEARMKSKHIEGVLVSCETGEGILELKERIFQSMGVIRVYTKEPGKAPSKEPIVLPVGSTVADAAERIVKGFSRRVRETRLTGPSGKFAQQRVGIKHVLKDRDVVEFKE